MSPRRFVMFAAAIGAVIPLVWYAIYWVFLRGNPDLINLTMSAWHFDRVLITIWPSWLFLIADPEERSIAIPAIAIIVNAALYSVFGWLIWVGLNRKRLVLGVSAVALFIWWYLLLRWYVGGSG